MKQLRTLTALGPEDRRELTKEEIRIFLMIGMEKPNIMLGKALIDQRDKNGDPPPRQVMAICKRLAAFTPEIEYDAHTVFLAGMLCENFGMCTLYAHTLAIETQKRHKVITAEVFGMELFPFGLPTEEGAQKIWIEQKGERGSKVDNWMDKQEAFVV